MLIVLFDLFIVTNKFIIYQFIVTNKFIIHQFYVQLQECFTSVLKGQIALDTAVFPNDTKGGLLAAYIFFDCHDCPGFITN